MSQVSWPRLVPLSLKLHGFTRLLELGRPGPALRADGDAAAILENFDALVKSTSPARNQSYFVSRRGDPRGCAPLDLYCARVGKALLTNNRRPGLSALGQRSLDALSTVCSDGLCAPCASGSSDNHVCRWQPWTCGDDREALQNRGLCLRPVRLLFDFCSEMADRHYSTNTAVHARRVLDWATGPANEPDSHMGIAIHGQTLERDAYLGGQWHPDSDSPIETSRRRTVHVSFDVESFWMDDYLALPYLIAHECIVHGHCGVAVDDAEADWSKGFHDGWMDVVAFAILEKELDRMAASDADAWVPKYRSEFQRVACAVKEKRYDESSPAAPADVTYWLMGALALQSFSHVVSQALWEIEACRPTDAHVESEVISLSIALNASDLSHAERGELIDVLTDKFSRNSDAERLEALRGTPAVEIVADHLEGRSSIGEMARQLTEL